MDKVTPLYKTLSLPDSFGLKLREGRLSRGLITAELAESVGVTAQAISQYEQGRTKPRGDVLAKICTTLNLPLGFFLDENRTIEPPEGPIFFRSLKSSSARSQDMMRIRANWSWRLFSYFERYIDFPEVKIYEINESKEPGQWAIEQLNQLAAEVRKNWGLGLGPISNVAALMENNGVVISRAYIGDTKLDAFSRWKGNRATMFLSSDKESAVRSRFDAAHELGHLILHTHIDLSEIKDVRQRNKILTLVEKEANNFAAAFLLPEETFCKEVYSPSIDHFITLKRRWKVSIAAMIYRCESLGLLSDNQVLYLRKQMAAKKMRTVEPLDNELPVEQPSLLATAIKMMIDNHVQTPQEISEALNLPYGDIENLCNLPEHTLKSKEANDNIVPIQFRS